MANLVNISASNVMRGTYGPYYSAGAPTSGTDEVQTLTGTATGGTFTLSFRGAVTAPLAFNASAATIQAALRGLSTINGAWVTCTGGALGSAGVVCTFSGGPLGGENLPALVIDNTLATGGTVTVAETTPGVPGTHKGALKGATLIDTTNALSYQNTGTDYSPTWTKVGTQT